MAEIEDLNVTDASNTGRFPENQAPSSVNDGARALAGLLARWRNDISGRVVTGGTANAQTLAAAGTYSAYADGMTFVFRAGATNTGATTLSVDGIGAIAVTKNNGAALVGGEIQAGGIYAVTLVAGSPNVWRLHNVLPLASIGEDIIPDADSTRDLGSSSRAWANLYLDTLLDGASGESVPALTVVQGSAKARANLNGTGTIALRDSFNTSSVVDNSTGSYTFNLSSAMSSANYNENGTSRNDAVSVFHTPIMNTATASSINIVMVNVAGSGVDSEYVMPVIVGDLA
jgi:hypothetical protein